MLIEETNIKKSRCPLINGFLIIDIQDILRMAYFANTTKTED